MTVPALHNQRVLVTGGSGAFGQAFARRALDDGAAKVVIYSRGEAKQAEMKAAMPDDRMRFVIGDVRSAERIYDACRGIDIVVHAAALKRVEVCEADPWETIQTNVMGTQHVARACIERGVARACFLSTDKAAAPATLYGASKLAAERLWLSSNVYAAGTATRFVGTRYGNVANSTGSVIPAWRRQAESGSISMTHPKMSRFLMSMEAAVDLVLLALSDMRPGALYVPKLRSASLADLAGVVAPHCSVTLTGARPGEKMHETLITEDEAQRTFDAGEFYLIEPSARPWGEIDPPAFPKVGPRFEYRSDTARTLSAHDLQALVAA